MHYLGLDVGDRWIGIAAGDSTSLLTSPLRTLRRSSRAADLAAIRRAYTDQNAEAVVVGLPRNMDGSIGPQARRTLTFAEALRAAGFTVDLYDERLSSFAAAEYVTATRGRRPRPGERIDHIAAAIILQDYLTSRVESPAPPLAPPPAPDRPDADRDDAPGASGSPGVSGSPIAQPIEGI